MFGLSVKGKYGLAAVLELGLYQDAGPLQIKTISQKRSIPHNYLEQVLVELKRAGIVKSFRGTRGGYSLDKDPSYITVNDVISCLEGPCQLSGNPCDCLVLTAFWKNAEDKITQFFQKSIADLIKEKLRSSQSLVYTI